MKKLKVTTVLLDDRRQKNCQSWWGIRWGKIY